MKYVHGAALILALGVVSLLSANTYLSAQTPEAKLGKPKAKAKDEPKLIGFAFTNERWSKVLGGWLVDNTGLILRAPHGMPTDTVTIVPPKDAKYTIAQIFDTLNEHLALKKWVLYRGQATFTVWPADQPLNKVDLPRVTPETLKNYGRTEPISMAIQLHTMLADVVAPDAKKMMGDFGEVVPLTSPNVLFVVGKAGEVSDLLRTINEAEKSNNRTLTHRCKFIRARIVGQKLKDLLAPENVSARGGQTATLTAQVSWDDNTQTVFVVGSPAMVFKGKSIIEKIDVGTVPLISGNPVIRRYVLPTDKAAEIAATIQEIHKDVVNFKAVAVNTNTIWVHAVPEDQLSMEKMFIKTGEASTPQQLYKVIPLATTDATVLVEKLKAMFGDTTNGGPYIDADATKNEIMFRGTDVQYKAVKNVVDTTDAIGAGGSRTITLSQGSARILAIELKRILEGMNKKVDLIVPGREVKPNPPQRPKRPKDDLEECGSEPVQVPPAGKKDAPPQKKKSSNTVTIQAFGNKLIVNTDDPATLRLIQETVQLLTSTDATAGDFQVIKLKNIDATDTATILDEAFNGKKQQTRGGGRGGFPGGGGGGRSSRGGGGGNPFSFIQQLAGGAASAITGAPAENRIRVVAHPATNALLIKATPLDFLTIKDLLKEHLDSDPDPNSKALVRTWTIGLKYTDVVDMAAIVEDVYRENMNNNPRGSTGGRTGGFTFGGFTRGGGSSRASPNSNDKVTLSVGADEQTNTLIVQCNENLKNDIEGLVKGLEDKAKLSTSQVQFIRIPGIDPNLVADAINAIQGKNTATSMRPGSQGGTSRFGSGFTGGGTGFGGRTGGTGFAGGGRTGFAGGGTGFAGGGRFGGTGFAGGGRTGGRTGFSGGGRGGRGSTGGRGGGGRTSRQSRGPDFFVPAVKDDRRVSSGQQNTNQTFPTSIQSNRAGPVFFEQQVKDDRRNSPYFDPKQSRVPPRHGSEFQSRYPVSTRQGAGSQPQLPPVPKRSNAVQRVSYYGPFDDQTGGAYLPQNGYPTQPVRQARDYRAQPAQPQQQYRPSFGQPQNGFRSRPVQTQPGHQIQLPKQNDNLAPSQFFDPRKIQGQRNPAPATAPQQGNSAKRLVPNQPQFPVTSPVKRSVLDKYRNGNPFFNPRTAQAGNAIKRTAFKPQLPAVQPPKGLPGLQPKGKEIRGPRSDVQIRALPELGGVIINTKNQEDMLEVLRIIELLKTLGAGAQVDIKLYRMKHQDATATTDYLNLFLSQVTVLPSATTTPGTSFQGAQTQGAVVLLPLPRLNSILIAAPKGRMPEVLQRLGDFDTYNRSPALPYKLKRASAAQVANLIATFYAQRYVGELQNQVKVTFDVNTNTVFVQAAPADQKDIGELILWMDNNVSGAFSDIRIVPLRHALATELAIVLQQAVSGGVAQQVSGVAGAGATGQLQQPGQQTLQPGGALQPGQLPGTTGAGLGQGGLGGITTGLVTKTSTLRYVVRMPLKNQKGELIKDKKGNPQFRELTFQSGILEDVRINADIRTNSLIIAAPEKTMDLIMQLVADLDLPPTARSDINVFPIKKTDAANIAGMLQQLFLGSAAGGVGGVGGIGGIGGQGIGGIGGQAGQGGALGAFGIRPLSITIPGRAPSPGAPLIDLRITIEPRTNSLIVAGSQSDLDVISTIISALEDSPVGERMHQVYRLKNAIAADVSFAINTFLQQEMQRIAGSPIMPLFEQLQREVVVVEEPINNLLLISATPKFFPKVMHLVQSIDQLPPQVVISAMIAEVTVDDLNEFGVEFGLQTPILFNRGLTDGGVATNIVAPGIPGFNFNDPNSPLPNASTASRGVVAAQGLNSLAVGRVSSRSGVGGLVFSAASDSVNILVRALRTQGRLDVLSRPQLMTTDNQQASILVGQDFPYITGTTTTQGVTLTPTVQNTVEYRPVGVSLQVIPKINPDGTVVMRVLPEVSSVTTTNVLVSNGVFASAFNTQRVDTTVICQDGETVVIGGMISRKNEKDENKIPWLGDLPGVGALFRYRQQSKTKTEVIIILTPHIVRCQADVDRIFAEESNKVDWILGDVLRNHGTYGMEPVMPGFIPPPQNPPLIPGSPYAPLPPIYGHGHYGNGPEAPLLEPGGPIQPEPLKQPNAQKPQKMGMNQHPGVPQQQPVIHNNVFVPPQQYPAAASGRQQPAGFPAQSSVQQNGTIVPPQQIPATPSGLHQAARFPALPPAAQSGAMVPAQRPQFQAPGQSRFVPGSAVPPSGNVQPQRMPASRPNPNATAPVRGRPIIHRFPGRESQSWQTNGAGS